MSELIAEFVSWLGYLERGSVQLQLLLLAAVLLSLRLRWTRRWLLKWPRAVSPLLGSVVALLLSLGLQARHLFILVVWPVLLVPDEENNH